jgi:hypothetical protein
LVTADEVCARPEKTAQILNWGVPQCLRDVRAFIGMTSYYRKFVKDYAAVAAPLTALMDKNRAFNWNRVCQEAFDKLKQA